MVFTDKQSSRQFRKMRSDGYRSRVGVLLDTRRAVAETVVPEGILEVSVGGIGVVETSVGVVAIEMGAAKVVADGPNVTMGIGTADQPRGNNSNRRSSQLSRTPREPHRARLERSVSFYWERLSG
jgi:hypothetical protein